MSVTGGVTTAQIMPGSANVMVTTTVFRFFVKDMNIFVLFMDFHIIAHAGVDNK